MATLLNILEARDHRAATQRQLLQKHHLPVVSMTVVMPGPEKLTTTSRYIAEVGRNIINSTFVIKEALQRDTPAGPEALYAVEGEPLEVKRACAEIEDQHPLGRLLDIDVISPDGTPLSREVLGLEPRRCLVCGDHAHSCVRSQRHTIPEVLSVIGQMVRDYQNLNSQ